VLFVEAAAMPGGAGLVLTGQLGDVMKESARIALTWVRSHAKALGIPDDAFRDNEFHVHVPAGAIPKDGPSAGITLLTAIVSLLTRRPVKHTVGMTGEVTLQGRVLPIGGVKQKVLAAHAAGLTEIILPSAIAATSTGARRRARADAVPPGEQHRRGAAPGARVRRRRAGGLVSGSGCGRAGARPSPGAASRR
jgi:ATP-dependent Lon protease